MAAHTTPADSTVDLAQVEAFFAEQLSLSDPECLPQDGNPALAKLPRRELVKVKDLCEDIMRLDTWADAGRLDRPTFLGWLFAWYEFLMSAPIWSPSRWFSIPASPRSRQALARHKPPDAADARPSQFKAEFHMFDRLSSIYGGNFRGSVVVNCGLGVIASTAVLYSLVNVHSGGATGWPLATIIEFACLVGIGLIYYRGSTPDLDAGDEYAPPPTMHFHLGARRWHQRWLEYRLLAERFRYVDLLLPLEIDPALNLAIAPTYSADLMWHQRYFQWRVKGALPKKQNVGQYRDHALAMIADQETYHEINHHRRGTIAHRLHRLAKFAFTIALVMCVFDIALAFHAPRSNEAVAISLWVVWLWPLLVWSWILGMLFRELEACLPVIEILFPFLAAWLPVIGAAAYAILTHAEYAKAADASGETLERIHHLYEKLASMPVSDKPADKDSLAEIGSIIVEFAETAIAEATGWRAMLRDKNVPLV